VVIAIIQYSVIQYEQMEGQKTHLKRQQRFKGGKNGYIRAEVGFNEESNPQSESPLIEEMEREEFRSPYSDQK